MVKAPVVATLAMEEPLIVPSSPEATMATLAGPPGLLPVSERARLLKNRAPPLPDRKAPNRMNRKMNVEETPTATPKTPSVVRYMCWTIRSRE